ncbi:30S ribosomal protein S17 [Myxococcus fulvus 124B02]|nr:30S ribosomal protein S17 [Myxococcus fulvus 124B02]
MAETTEAPKAETSSRGRPKTRVGIVTSNKMQKTVVVTVQRRAPHPKYGKIMSLREKYKAHRVGRGEQAHAPCSASPSSLLRGQRDDGVGARGHGLAAEGDVVAEGNLGGRL